MANSSGWHYKILCMKIDIVLEKRHICIFKEVIKVTEFLSGLKRLRGGDLLSNQAVGSVVERKGNLLDVNRSRWLEIQNKKRCFLLYDE